MCTPAESDHKQFSEYQQSECNNQERHNMTTGQSGSSFIAQGTGVRQLTQWQNTENLQNSVPVDKFLELLLQNLHLIQKENKELKDHCGYLEQKVRLDEMRVTPTTSKEPVSRSKSAPESYDKLQDMRKASSPQVFVFPDTKQRPDKYSSDDRSQDSSMNVSADGASGSSEGPGSLSSEKYSFSDRDSSEFLSLRDSFQEPPGVSAQYFNNVINELMKTKTMLHNLQLKQKTQFDSSTSEQAMDKMRKEIQQLRISNQKLQRDLQEKEKEIEQLKVQHVQVKDESFELCSESELGEHSKTDSDPSSQGSTEAEIQRLREEIEELVKQNQLIMEEKKKFESILLKDKNDISRELMLKNEAYNRLQDNVKILTSCLQEEKTRSKNADEKLKIKIDETRKISARLGSLRQQYEELRQEKNALEKTCSLEGFPSRKYKSKNVPSDWNRSCGSSWSAEITRYGSSRSNPTSSNSTYGPFNIGPENKHFGTPQNDLSSEFEETKLSNITQLSAMSGPKYECPRCLQTFQMEYHYQHHLDSCID